MKAERKSFQEYLQEIQPNGDSKKYITIEVEESTYTFFQDASTYFDISTENAINSILANWINEYANDMRADVVRRITNVKI